MMRIAPFLLITLGALSTVEAQIITGNTDPTGYTAGDVFNAASFEFYSGSPSPARGFYIGTYNSNTTFDTDPATPGIQGNILVPADSIASFRVEARGADAEIVFGGRNGATLDYLSGTEGGNLSEVYAATGTNTINRAIDRPGSLPNAQMSNVTDRGAMAISSVNGGSPNGKRFAIIVDTAFSEFPGYGLTDLKLTFAGSAVDASSGSPADGTHTITWYYSVDGGATAVPVGVTTTITGQAYALYGPIDFSAFDAVEFVENLVILGQVGGVGTRSELRIDNLQVYGALASRNLSKPPFGNSRWVADVQREGGTAVQGWHRSGWPTAAAAGVRELQLGMFDDTDYPWVYFMNLSPRERLAQGWFWAYDPTVGQPPFANPTPTQLLTFESGFYAFKPDGGVGATTGQWLWIHSKEGVAYDFQQNAFFVLSDFNWLDNMRTDLVP